MGDIIRRGTRDKPRFYIRYLDLDGGRKTRRRDGTKSAPCPKATSTTRWPFSPR